jgi:preprotein translocase SecE subunit
MARQTRQQRRARRAQSQPALAGGPPVRPPARPTANGGDGAPEPARRQPHPEAGERHVPGSGFVHFIREAWAELKKVEWPTQQALISGTAVVIVACLIVGFYLWLNDELWKYVVQHVLLR